MNGRDVKNWRKRNQYSQKELQVELGFKSRTSISAIENQQEPIPRQIELALAALEIAPILRERLGFSSNQAQTGRSLAYPNIAEKDLRDIYCTTNHGRYAKTLSDG